MFVVASIPQSINSMKTSHALSTCIYNKERMAQYTSYHPAFPLFLKLCKRNVIYILYYYMSLIFISRFRTLWPTTRGRKRNRKGTSPTSDSTWHCDWGRWGREWHRNDCQGLLFAAWVNVCPEPELPKGSQIYIWGISESVPRARFFKAVSKGPGPQGQASGLKEAFFLSFFLFFPESKVMHDSH